MILFLGRFHPLVLHLPIGLMAGWMLLEAMQFRYKEQLWLQRAAYVLAIATAGSGVLACLLGLMLAFEPKLNYSYARNTNGFCWKRTFFESLNTWC